MIDNSNAYIVKTTFIYAAEHLTVYWHLKGDPAGQAYHETLAMNYLNEALRHMGLIAVEAPAGHDRSIGMTVRDAG